MRVPPLLSLITPCCRVIYMNIQNDLFLLLIFYSTESLHRKMKGVSSLSHNGNAMGVFVCWWGKGPPSVYIGEIRG